MSDSTASISTSSIMSPEKRLLNKIVDTNNQTTNLNSISFTRQLESHPRLKKEDVQSLREWAEKQRHLPNLSDSDLALFLGSCDYVLDAAKNRIRSFFAFREFDLFADRDTHNAGIREALDIISVVALKEKTADGYTVILSKLLSTDWEAYNYTQQMKICSMVLDICIYENGMDGKYIFIIDLKGMTSGHFISIKDRDVTTFPLYILCASPAIWKSIHYVNANRHSTIFQHFIESAFKDSPEKLYFHATLEEMENHVPRNILPNEMNGNAGRLEDLHKEQIKKLESYNDWFVKDKARHRINAKRSNFCAVELNHS